MRFSQKNLEDREDERITGLETTFQDELFLEFDSVENARTFFDEWPPGLEVRSLEIVRDPDVPYFGEFTINTHLPFVEEIRMDRGMLITFTNVNEDCVIVYNAALVFLPIFPHKQQHHSLYVNIVDMTGAYHSGIFEEWFDALKDYGWGQNNDVFIDFWDRKTRERFSMFVGSYLKTETLSRKEIFMQVQTRQDIPIVHFINPRGDANLILYNEVSDVKIHHTLMRLMRQNRVAQGAFMVW